MIKNNMYHLHLNLSNNDEDVVSWFVSATYKSYRGTKNKFEHLKI